MKIEVIEPQIEELTIESIPCCIKKYDDKVVIYYNISNLKIYTTTYVEMLKDIIVRLKIITERLMLERGISYDSIETPYHLTAIMYYTVR